MSEMWHFWYSAQQARADDEMAKIDTDETQCFLEVGGRRIEYTECNDSPTPAGLWTDYEYLGCFPSRCIRVAPHPKRRKDRLSTHEQLEAMQVLLERKLREESFGMTDEEFLRQCGVQP